MVGLVGVTVGVTVVASVNSATICAVLVCPVFTGPALEPDLL